MLLRGVQTYPRRKWLEEYSVDVKILKNQFGEMAESEAELRKVLNTLNRDPGGMVFDFDLHMKRSAPHDRANNILATIGECGQITPPLRSSVFATLQTARNQDSEPPLKRLRTKLDTSVSVMAKTWARRGCLLCVHGTFAAPLSVRNVVRP